MSRVGLLSLVLLISTGAVHALIDIDSAIMGRGDVNNNGVVNLTDVVYLNNYLFSGGPAPPCLNNADANDDGTVTSADSAYLLSWLFSGGPAPPAPGPFNNQCVADALPRPGCVAHLCQ